jgi:hypothetical protein
MDPFKLEVDASGFAMGAVLLQKKADNKKHPIAYYSKTLSTVERNYDMYDLELLAIVNTLDHWRPYLAGSLHKIIIHSDHQNLLYWKEPHKISCRVAREVLMLLVKWEGYPDLDNMWVDKDDVFTDDKIQEFKDSNPKSETHIRSTSFTKSPHSSAHTRSQLLYQHTLSYMSSDGNNEFAFEYPAGAIADSPVPFSQENPNSAPIPASAVPIIDFTLQPLNSAATVFSP